MVQLFPPGFAFRTRRSILAPVIFTLLRATRQIRFTTVLAGLFGLYLVAPGLFPIRSLPYQSSIAVFVCALAVQRVWGYALVSLPLMIGLTFWLSLLALTAPNAKDTIRSYGSSLRELEAATSLSGSLPTPRAEEFEEFFFDENRSKSARNPAGRRGAELDTF